MMTFARFLAGAAGAALLLAGAAEAREPARYTAQRRPRVAVLGFKDANAEAPETRHAASVQAMLETSLQRRSQFVVVERKNLGGLLEERQRMQNGMVDIPPDDTTSRELLEKVDAYIQGTVTLLSETAEDKIHGRRIEIDAKLYFGFGGRLIVTAQRSGPEACLRSVVERLGITLERNFLRSYYSKLTFELKEPENVRIFLTPIPLDTERDEENPPAERSTAVTIGGEYDTVEPWTTDPTTYTIENLLSGWYFMRLARPGYAELKTDAARWEVRNRSGTPEVYDRLTGQPLSVIAPELRRSIVHVDPLAIEVIDGDALGFVFHKQGGSLAPRVRRQYLDADFSQVPQRVVLMGGKGLHLNNNLETPEEFSDNPDCDLFDKRQPTSPEFFRTHVTSGQAFDFDRFKGGELIIDDYKGEIVPAGQYQIVLWDPNYQVEKAGVVIRDGDIKKVTQTSLARETLPLKLEVTGARPENRVILRGRDTHYQLELPFDFAEVKEQRGLPADVYRASTDIPGLDGWRQTVELHRANVTPPKYFTRSGVFSPKITQASEDDKLTRAATLTIKTRLALAGRLDAFSLSPVPPAADLFMDRELPKILDLLLRGQELQSGGNPQDLDQLRELLAQRLKVIDLLVFDPHDMAQIRRSPEVAAIVRNYLQEGGALLAFVAEAGDYGEVVGAPLVIGTASDPTDRFELAPGDVSGFVPRLGRKVEVRSKRALPELSRLPAQGPWRVLAFTRERQSPRIVERGERESGGYVALWLDDPSSFRGPRGETIPAVQEARAKVEERVLKWARYLMYRRYDKGGKQRQQAELELGR